MRPRVRSARRRVNWENGATFAPVGSFVVPSISGTSSYVADWLRVPAGTYDNINEREVPIDWTLIRSIFTACFTVHATSNFVAGFITGIGVIAWDGVSDDVIDPLATPLPIQQGGLDWIWTWTQPFTKTLFAAEELFGQNLDSPEGMVFSKSQRKLSAGTGLLAVAEMYATTNLMDATWGFSLHARTAYKLP